MSDKPIDAEVVQQTQAVALRQAGAVGSALTVDELHAALEYVREVMRKEMRDGTDYGKIPGCGDKPSLLQPGAQKLLMTFNLCEFVRKEEVRDLPNYHREYAFTICVRAPNGKEWDGVGTCSTLEAKYRYRQAQRRCPECGKNAIIQGKAEYGGGWVCFKKKNGCGAKFAENDERITSQDAGTVEHDNPADYWNTVRKMAFKRALVSAAINATNTSELWTQDVEDMRENDAAAPKNATGRSRGYQDTTHAPKAAPTPKPAPNPAPKAEPGPIYKLPTAQTRLWMIRELSEFGTLAKEYFEKCGQLLPTEGLADLPLRFVPWSKDELAALKDRLRRFGDGDRAEPAFTPHWEAEGKPPVTPAQVAPKPGDPNPLWWENIIISVPRKGMKRADYIKQPDTIGSLFALRHQDTEEAATARQRLFGLVHNWKPEARTVNGKVYEPSVSDLKCREGLDAFLAWWNDAHRGEKL